MPDGATRVGDWERQQVADQLRSHFTAGRLDVDEFSDRLGEALRATTSAELALALRDLPPAPRLPVPELSRPGPVPAEGRRQPRRPSAPLWVFAMIVLASVAIAGHFWPVWVIAIVAFFVWRRSCHPHYRRRERSW